MLTDDQRKELAEFAFYAHTRTKKPSNVKTFKIEELGRGAFGAVYLVDGIVVKVLTLTKNDRVEVALQEEKRFLEEVEGWRELSQVEKLQRFLPKYLGFYIYKHVPDKDLRKIAAGLEGRALYMIPDVKVIGCIFQEYEEVEPLDFVIRDMSMHSRMRVSRLLKEETTAKMFLDNLIKGYKYLHEAGYIHRDIKPANILVRVDEDKVDVPMIIDIGMLCKTPCPVTSLSGTLAYLPQNYISAFNRRPGREFNVENAHKPWLSKKIKDGLFKLIGRRIKHPIRPTRSKVRLAAPNAVAPFYTVDTDNYALAITIQDFIKHVNWKGDEYKEIYKLVAFGYIKKAAANIAAKEATRRAPNIQKALGVAPSLNLTRRTKMKSLFSAVPQTQAAASAVPPPPPPPKHLSKPSGPKPRSKPTIATSLAADAAPKHTKLRHVLPPIPMSNEESD
jgi:serine/threonine protein kinase